MEHGSKDPMRELEKLHMASLSHNLQLFQRSQAQRRWRDILTSNPAGVRDLVAHWNERGLCAMDPEAIGGMPTAQKHIPLHPYEAYFQVSSLSIGAVDAMVYGQLAGLVGYFAASVTARRLQLPRPFLLTVPVTVLFGYSMAKWRWQVAALNLFNTTLLFPESPLSNASRRVIADMPPPRDVNRLTPHTLLGAAVAFVRAQEEAQLGFAEAVPFGSSELGQRGSFDGGSKGNAEERFGTQDYRNDFKPDMWEEERDDTQEYGDDQKSQAVREFDQGKSWEDIRRGMR